MRRLNTYMDKNSSPTPNWLELLFTILVKAGLFHLLIGTAANIFDFKDITYWQSIQLVVLTAIFNLPILDMIIKFQREKPIDDKTKQ